MDEERTSGLILRLFKNDKRVGWMKITDRVELSLDRKVWVDYGEGICEYGMNLKWDEMEL